MRPSVSSGYDHKNQWLAYLIPSSPANGVSFEARIAGDSLESGVEQTFDQGRPESAAQLCGCLLGNGLNFAHSASRMARAVAERCPLIGGILMPR